MKQVTILNNKNQNNYGQKFSNDSIMQIWIDACIADNSWGLAERIVNAEPVDYPLEDVTEEIPAVVDENNNIITPAQVKLCCQYTITISDLTNDPDYILEKELKKAGIRHDVCKFLRMRVSARNRIVGLTAEQTLVFITNYKSIIELLSVDELSLARAAIFALVPDESLLQSEIDLLVAIADAGILKESEVE